jgi:uncharacterized protein (TIGR03663 family)
MVETLHPSMEQRAARTAGNAVHAQLTVERALYLCLGLLALMARLYALDRRPMQPQEAHQALASWQLLQGQSAETAGCSPLVLTANVVLFALFGANDASARLLPVLSGTMLVLLPYGLRRWLGREGALIGSALLAFSPLLLFNARYLDGATPAAAGMLLLLIGLGYWSEGRRSGMIHVASAGLATLLLAGPQAYTLLLIVATFGILIAVSGRRGPLSAQRAEGDGPHMAPCVSHPTRDDWSAALRQAGISLTLILGFVATCFLLNPSGLQALLDLLPAWGRGFITATDGLPWMQYLALLPLYDPLVLVAGLAGLALACRERDPLGLFLSYWALAALVLTSLMAGRGAGDALLVILPLALLAGRFLGRRLPEWMRGATWAQEGFFGALSSGLAIYAGLQLTFFSVTGKAAYLQVMGVVAVLIVGLFASVAYWLGRQAACAGVGLVLLLTLAVSTLSAGIGLNYVHVADPHELALAGPISLQTHALLGDVSRLSAQRAIDERALDLTIHRSLARPLAWYLRDYPNLKVVESLAPTVHSDAVIAPVMAESPPLGGAYGGQDYLFQSWWDLATLRGSDWGKWLLRRQASTPVREQRAILWVQQEER